MDAICALDCDFREVSGNDNTVSQEDLSFLDKLQEGRKKTEGGHYEMALPFKEGPQMPGIRQLTEVRLNHLKRKFTRDEKYKVGYIKDMNDVIERGEAEDAKGDGLPSETWYIPHHGIYHSKKPEKRQVSLYASGNIQ